MITHPWRILVIDELRYLLCLVCNAIDPDPEAIRSLCCRACRLRLTEVPDTYTQEEHRQLRKARMLTRGRAIYPMMKTGGSP
jgi:hypothetical protein